MNTRCFAYKDKTKAKKEFYKNFDKCKEIINSDIKKHFKSL